MNFTFRRVTRADFPTLAGWLSQPHVAEWWAHDTSDEAIERDFGDAVDGREPGQDWLAMLDDRPFGLIQYSHFVDYPEYVEEMAEVYPVGPGAVSIDYLIGDRSDTGRGQGTAMIAAFVARIWSTDAGAAHVVVPVNSANVASWRALLAAGFVVVARGNLEPDNPAHDPLHEILRTDRPPAT